MFITSFTVHFHLLFLVSHYFIFFFYLPYNIFKWFLPFFISFFIFYLISFFTRHSFIILFTSLLCAIFYFLFYHGFYNWTQLIFNILKFYPFSKFLHFPDSFFIHSSSLPSPLTIPPFIISLPHFPDRLSSSPFLDSFRSFQSLILCFLTLSFPSSQLYLFPFLCLFLIYISSISTYHLIFLSIYIFLDINLFIPYFLTSSFPYVHLYLFPFLFLFLISISSLCLSSLSSSFSFIHPLTLILSSLIFLRPHSLLLIFTSLPSYVYS